MARLIDADALFPNGVFYVNGSNPMTSLDELLNRIQNAPTADAAPMKHGRWLGTHDGWFYSYSCSECGAEALTKEETMHDQVCSNYCPYCGAKMDGEA